MLKKKKLNFTAEIFFLLSEIDHCKRNWKKYEGMMPGQLSLLKWVSKIESISSCFRLEGYKLKNWEVESMMDYQNNQPFQTLEGRLTCGHAELLNILSIQYKNIPITGAAIQQMHMELFRYLEKDATQSGKYKTENNFIGLTPKGKNFEIILETAKPTETSVRMIELLEWAQYAYAETKLHPLVITSIFTAEFLAIFPFQEGNGRLAGALATLLLLKSGYEYTQYSSLESIIEIKSKDFCNALSQTYNIKQKGKSYWQPWVLFFLRALQLQKIKLLQKVTDIGPLVKPTLKLSNKIMESLEARGSLTTRELIFLTKGSRLQISKQLKCMVDDKVLVKNLVGRTTVYSLFPTNTLQLPG